MVCDTPRARPGGPSVNAPSQAAARRAMVEADVTSARSVPARAAPRQRRHCAASTCGCRCATVVPLMYAGAAVEKAPSLPPTAHAWPTRVRLTSSGEERSGRRPVRSAPDARPRRSRRSRRRSPLRRGGVRAAASGTREREQQLRVQAAGRSARNTRGLSTRDTHLAFPSSGRPRKTALRRRGRAVIVIARDVASAAAARTVGQREQHSAHGG